MQPSFMRNKDEYYWDNEYEYVPLPKPPPKNWCSCWKIAIIITILTVLILIIGAFTLMFSLLLVSVQKYLILDASGSEINHYTDKLGIYLMFPFNVSIILIRPEKSWHTNFSLENNLNPILLHFPASDQEPLPINAFLRLRQNFVIISIKYKRNNLYSHPTIIQDYIQVYEWLVNQKNCPSVVFWGKSMGAALAALTMRRLKEKKLRLPAGLILESPYASMEDKFLEHPLIKLYRWVPFFEKKLISSIRNNWFQFDTINDLKVLTNSSVLIFYEENDHLGRKFAELAQFNGKTCYKVSKFYMHYANAFYDPRIMTYIETNYIKQTVSCRPTE